MIPEPLSPTAAQAITDFFRSGQPRAFARHDLILKELGPTEEILLLESGYVKMVSVSARQRERIHFTFRPGELFPLANLFDTQPLGVSYVAVNDAKVFAQPLDASQNFFRQHPQDLSFIIGELLQQREGLFTLSIGNAMERIVQHLIILIRRFGTRTNDHVVIDLPITQQELAAGVNLTRESTARALKHLERDQALLLGRRRIIIYPQALNHFIDSHRLMHVQAFALGLSPAA